MADQPDTAHLASAAPASTADAAVPPARKQRGPRARSAPSSAPNNSPVSRALKLIGMVIITPLALALFIVWWLLGRVRSLALLDTLVVVSCYLHAGSLSSSTASPSIFPSDRDATFSTSLLDVVLLSVCRLVITYAVAVKWRHRSIERRSFFIALAIAFTAYLAVKLQPGYFGYDTADLPVQWRAGAYIAKLARCILVYPIITAWLLVVCEVWVPSTLRQLHAAERALLRSKGDQFMQHVQLKKCRHTGIAYLRYDPHSAAHSASSLIAGDAAAAGNGSKGSPDAHAPLLNQAHSIIPQVD